MKIILILLLLIFCICLVSPKELNQRSLSYTVKTKKIECLLNPDYFVNVSCRLKPISWSRTLANVEGYIIQQLENVSVRTELYKYTNQFRPFFLNITSNICKWLRNERQDSYTNSLLRLMKQFTNINHTCPYKGRIFGKDIYFEPKVALFVIPPGTYKFVFTMSEGYPYIQLGTLKYVVEVSDIQYSRGTPKRDRLYLKTET